MAEKGTLSINSENMFPIIKKWLYSDHDIFVRELISNGCDAVTKLKKLEGMGEAALPEGYKARIDVEVDSEEKTIRFIDNGIGMTADEVREYINNIAFSGAADFLEKYKDKANGDQIIGHFGLGFYSAFMVAGLVEIDTLSYKEGAAAVHWTCDGGSEYNMEDGERDSFGTTITLHLTEDCGEFANVYRAREVIEKYCSFMPTEIYLRDVNEKEGETLREPMLMNDPAPLWTRTPKDCTEEEYKEFYRKVFKDYKEPLFWIHLNMDYPFNLKGILYFPQINMEYESIDGVIKLYNNQVFIADNIKEVIPEFLMLLKGVIDCPDLPLNVSRSALQNDGFVKKISDYISKKVADKLSGMCKTDRENYEKYWDSISPFIKYGCLRDDKFCERITNYILFKDLDGKYAALPDALLINQDAGEEPEVTEENGATAEAQPANPDRTIYYVTDEQQQGQYIQMFKSAGMQAFILTHNIDQAFISQLEAKNEGLHFARIDANVQDALKARTGKKTAAELNEKAESLRELGRKLLKKDKLELSLMKLKNKKVASMLTVDEQNRRMNDMMKMYAANGMGFGMPELGEEGETLVLNASHPLVQHLMDSENGPEKELVLHQLYDLAKLQNAPLTTEEMAAFVARSNEILAMSLKS